jgi:hypothetical protein
MSTASKDSVNQQGYLNDQSQKLSAKKAQLQARYDRLSKSTEQCRKVELRYNPKNIVIGVESTRGRRGLQSRPEIPEFRILSRNSYPSNYASWAKQVRMYLFARGVSYVLNETDEENIPSTYDSLNTTLGDRDDALARYVISTALTESQNIPIRDKKNAKEFWFAFKLAYGPSDAVLRIA